MKLKLVGIGLVALVAVASCSGKHSMDSDDGGSAGGGNTIAGGTGGGAGGSGGTTGSSGGSATGGATSTGGSAITGGATGTGGRTTVGGSTGAGGSAGTATGGSAAAGGAGTGGRSAAGGTTAGGGGDTAAKGGASGRGGGGGTARDGGGAGTTGTGGVATGGTTGAGGGTVASACGLPPGPSSGIAKPAGSGTKIDVLPWASFKAATSFSLDDGDSSQISNYATLNGTGVKFTFYLVTGWSSAKDAIWTQAIKDGHEIGNHTQDHKCSTASAGQSDLKNKPLSVTAYTMAAPNGDTTCGSSVDSLNLLLNRGVNGGSVSFTADETTVAKNLPTSLPATGAAASALTSTIDSAYNKGEWQTFCIHGFTGSSAYQPIPLASLTDAIKTEKQKKDLWIDTMQAVGAYWRAGRTFAKATKTTSGSDTTWKWTVEARIPPNTCLRVKPDGGVVKQKGAEVPWDDHGYYEISFNAGEVTLSAQ